MGSQWKVQNEILFKEAVRPRCILPWRDRKRVAWLRPGCPAFDVPTRSQVISSTTLSAAVGALGGGALSDRVGRCGRSFSTPAKHAAYTAHPAPAVHRPFEMGGLWWGRLGESVRVLLRLQAEGLGLQASQHASRH